MHEDEVFLKEAGALHNLRALEEIEKNPQISQRELSNHLGVALGITNALLRALVRKGLIKINGENNRSLTYHLTHAGVLAKSQLALKWTLNTIDFYRQARLNVVNNLMALAGQDVESVVLYGSGELFEIVAIVAAEANLRVVGIVNNRQINDAKTMLGHPVTSLEQLAVINPDAVVVCIAMDVAGLDELGNYVNDGTKLYRLI